MTESLLLKEIGTEAIEVHGYHLLVKAPAIAKQTSGGVLLPDEWREVESRAPNVGLVIAMGPDCYLPPEKFHNKPRCKVGDWIIYSMYERQAEKINGHLCYFIVDERVLATVKDISTMLKNVEGTN